MCRSIVRDNVRLPVAQQLGIREEVVEIVPAKLLLEMKMSFLGLMVKKLNHVENTIDKFDDLTLNVAKFVSEKYDGESNEPNDLAVPDVIGSVLMSMMLPGLIVATYFLIIKVIISMGSRFKFNILNPMLKPIKYRKLNKISLRDPEMLASPRNPRNQSCMFFVRVGLTILMIISACVVFLGHCYIWNSWGANIDSVQHFVGDHPMSLRELHGEMTATLSTVSRDLEAVQAYMHRGFAELSSTSAEMQDIIEDKMERVTMKSAEFSDLAWNLDSFIIDSDNKTLSIFLSFCYVASSVVSMWFWYLLISCKFTNNLGWFAAVLWWCSTFLTFILVNLYSSMFLPYLTSVIQQDSGFILKMMEGS